VHIVVRHQWTERDALLTVLRVEVTACDVGAERGRYREGGVERYSALGSIRDRDYDQAHG